MPFLLIIKERSTRSDGCPPISTHHPTREAAESALLDYVAYKWDVEIGDERPGDPTLIINKYFSQAREVFEILEVPETTDTRSKQ